MSKYFITGVSGFVGRYLVSHIQKEDGSACIYGAGKRPDCNLPINYFQIDLKEQSKVALLLKEVQPDFIVHLASMSSIQESWNNPQECFENNAKIILNILTAVKDNKLQSRILSVGSVEEYGSYPESEMPLKENYPLNPMNPYAVTKVFQENICKIYADYFGLDIVMTRSFNHYGVGQSDKFFIASMIKQLLEIKHEGKSSLEVGNIDVKRDFIDVRDAADIYFRLLLKGKKGEIYNVCSGTPVSLREVIKSCCRFLIIDPEIRVDVKRIRPSDIQIIYGDNTKLKKETGWNQKYSLETSLKEIIDEGAK